MTDKPKTTTTYTDDRRFLGVESTIRGIMSQNRDLRKESKEAEWKRNNPNHKPKS